MFFALRRPLANKLRTFRSFAPKMAKSKFEYVKSFETEDRLDPGHWIVVALRCKNHDRICGAEGLLERPNDPRLVQLMEASAQSVMEGFKDLVLAYGFAGEFSFVFPKKTTLYSRRAPKLLTNLCSLMASSVVHKWGPLLGSMLEPPVIEGAIYLLPNDQALRDYLTQRQLACHHRNLYNTAHWGLVLKEGLSPEAASEALKGTSEGDQNEILFSRCGTNYNNEKDVFKKGSVLLRARVQTEVTTPHGSSALRSQSRVVGSSSDFARDDFWAKSSLLQEPTKLGVKTHYLKDFERRSPLLPHTWIVVRIDGKGFHKFSEIHDFAKPNDLRSIELMNLAAIKVMEEFQDIVLSYGQSDEYSFILDRYSNLYGRQGNAIMSCIVSLFAATYAHNWERLFKDVPLRYCPAFDARVVLYPNATCLRDYLSWRQADCHINNMYNTCFWALVRVGGCTRREAEERLKGTFSKDKRNILRTQFGMDYDAEDAIYRKGTILLKDPTSTTDSQGNGLSSTTNSQENGLSSTTDSQGNGLFSTTDNQENGPSSTTDSQGNGLSSTTDSQENGLSSTTDSQENGLSSTTDSQENGLSSTTDSQGNGLSITKEHIDMIGDQFWKDRPWILGTEKQVRLMDEYD